MTQPQDTLPQDLANLQSRMSAAVREHWKAFLAEGILLAILGLAAIIVPPFASLAVTIFLGWMFLISGIGGLIVTFWARQLPGFWWSLISALLAIAAGVILLAQPVQGTLTLTSPKASPPSCTRSSIAANCRGAGPGSWSPA